MNVRDPAQRKTAPAAQMPLALYQQVKDHVLRKIGDGSLAAGARVPSEQELVNEFGVARQYR